MKNFVSEHDLGSLTHLADTELAVWDAFGVQGQPAWAFFNGETGTASLRFGPQSRGELNNQVNNLR